MVPADISPTHTHTHTHTPTIIRMINRKTRKLSHNKVERNRLCFIQNFCKELFFQQYIKNIYSSVGDRTNPWDQESLHRFTNL